MRPFSLQKSLFSIFCCLLACFSLYTTQFQEQNHPKDTQLINTMRFTLICVCILIGGNEISGTAFTLTSVLGSTNDPNLPDRCYGGDLSESLKSGANDMVIVPQTDGTLKSTPLQVRVGKLSNWRTIFKSRKAEEKSKLKNHKNKENEAIFKSGRAMGKNKFRDQKRKENGV